ncbi:MAG: hypothetical protein AUH92_01665 [Acidobacteria bacterium 13_1_40CM_4_69_4]|nr:MAG: hypothetical protein AUH92_01665 [Acidobacteria bacterium 13_1_40CM_4_69_4]
MVCAALSALVPALDGCHGESTDGGAIRALVEKEVAAINARDLRALSEIWSTDKDILLFDVPPPGRFRGWDQIGPVWKDFFEKVSDVHMTVDAVRATSEGSLGYATYDWAMTGRLGSYTLDDRGEATAIYRKEGGQWRLVHAHFSPAPPALAGQPARSAAPSRAGESNTGPSGAVAGKPADAGQQKPGTGPPGAPAASPTPGDAGKKS